eukprot:TRINITY_DN278_c0_g1_i4.p1 TRINITY_DN278_c0_g1~~TRINITY_DN278_c0_g1_i4.p1  ORF type:complete len:216 (-),score=19.82 TRINITY_DN278_c0_g1_i4:317-904(-)
MAEKAGMSTGTKIAMGVAGAVGAAVIGAATFGGGYVIYKNVKGKQQDASPLQLHILVKNAKNLKDEDTFGESDPYVVVEVDDVKKRTKTVSPPSSGPNRKKNASVFFFLLEKLSCHTGVHPLPRASVLSCLMFIWLCRWRTTTAPRGTRSSPLVCSKSTWTPTLCLACGTTTMAQSTFPALLPPLIHAKWAYTEH